MVEFSVILRRFPGSARPDVCIYSGEDRGKALAEMHRYGMKTGFAVEDHDGLHTVATIELVEKEPIAGAPVLSAKPWHELFDENGNRRKDT
jgi:hypothetical protein